MMRRCAIDQPWYRPEFSRPVFFLGQLVTRIMGEGQWAFLLRESLLIGGWVAMWKPLEIFLYDLWPIVGEGRLYDGLSRIDVEIIQVNSKSSNPQTFGTETAPSNPPEKPTRV